MPPDVWTLALDVLILALGVAALIEGGKAAATAAGADVRTPRAKGVIVAAGPVLGALVGAALGPAMGYEVALGGLYGAIGGANSAWIYRALRPRIRQLIERAEP